MRCLLSYLCSLFIIVRPFRGESHYSRKRIARRACDHLKPRVKQTRIDGELEKFLAKASAACICGICCRAMYSNSGVRSRSPGAKKDKVHAFINFDALVFSRYVVPNNPTYDQIFMQIRSFERGKGKEKKKLDCAFRKEIFFCLQAPRDASHGAIIVYCTLFLSVVKLICVGAIFR